MLELMTNVPPHVAAFRATGEVTKDDYEKVLIPAIDKAAKEYGALHFLMVLETDISNFTLGAWMDDAKVGLKHFTKWYRMAIVTDQKGVEKFSDLFGIVVPGETKGFALSEINEAIEWVSAKEQD
jgi:hypothetical protein